MRRPNRITVFLLLAACADPLQSCLDQADRDLRVVQDLIDDSEATLDRGYAIQTETRFVLYTDFCFGRGNRHGNFTFCKRTQPVTSRTPVAVDLEEERRKLRALKRKEVELQARTRSAVASCQSAYPEG